MKKTLACAKLLLDNGANPNKKAPIVNLFINKKALPLIHLLLDYKIDLTKTKKHDTGTALHCAVLVDSARTALALDNGADPNQKDRRSLTAKEWLLKLNQPNTSEILKIFEARGL